jgi:hypothetical protein
MAELETQPNEGDVDAAIEKGFDGTMPVGESA